MRPGPPVEPASPGAGAPGPRGMPADPAMRVEAFDFELPEEAIALRPASPRDSARLLVVRPGAPAELEDRVVRDLPDLLEPGDLVIFNDTRVIPARLTGVRTREGGSSV